MNDDRDERWLCDLDGVVWLADRPIPGAADALARLSASGRQVAFFTNNSHLRLDELVAKLERCGVPARREDVLTSSAAAAGLLEPGERALVLGGPGILEALAARAVDAVDASGASDGPVDAVVVGIDLRLSYERLALAGRAVLDGARLIATNDDPTFPTPEGLRPGAGAILSALVAMTGAVPLVAGKPHPPAVELVRRRLHRVDVVVGDRPATDGELARALGARFALVRSGVTPAGAPPGAPAPDLDARDLAGLVAAGA
ncbi:MAG TPA: HAD-IIA family hydrolase [Acidimicrobiales bacterium]|nr:HAD-IIA family hydrolase [Acidimicrobiales bacterium]